MKLGAIVREPLLHFLIAGAGLFLLFGLSGDADDDSSRQIRVTPAQVQQLAAQFSRTWMRPPLPAELTGLIDRHVRNEVYYREALAMGLDQDDPYLRNRLRQKLEFLLDDLSAEVEPSDETLAAFLNDHPAQFRRPTIVSFRQVYLNPDKHPNLEADAGSLLRALRAGDPPDGMGDVSMLGSAFDAVSQQEIGRQFGPAFADAVVALEPGTWVGPIRSGLGAHLVLVSDRQPARLPALDEVRGPVLREWRNRHRQEQQEQTYRRLRERYEVVIEPAAEAAVADVAASADSAVERP